MSEVREAFQSSTPDNSVIGNLTYTRLPFVRPVSTGFRKPGRVCLGVSYTNVEMQPAYFVEKLVSLNRSVRVSILLVRRAFRPPLTYIINKACQCQVSCTIARQRAAGYLNVVQTLGSSRSQSATTIRLPRWMRYVPRLAPTLI